MASVLTDTDLLKSPDRQSNLGFFFKGLSPDTDLLKGLCQSVRTLFCRRALAHVLSPDSVLLKGLGHQS